MGISKQIRRMINRAILRRLPPCEELAQVISASLDRRLTFREKIILKAHLFACKPCVRYLDQSDFVRTATKLLTEREKDALFAGRLTEESRNRIKSGLKASLAVIAICLTY